MQKFQSFVLVALLAVTGVLLAMQNRTKAKLRIEQESARKQAEAFETLSSENQRLSNLLARANTAAPPAPAANDQFRELMKLRGEVGVLRREVDEATAAAAPMTNSVLSGLTSNPEMYKMLRDQQRAGLGMLYGDFARKMNLPEEQKEQFNDLLADNVMANIDTITAALRDGKSPAEMDQLFTAQEARLKEQVKQLLGPETSAQYEDYTQNLLSHISAQQFKSMMMTGEGEAKDDKARQLYKILQEESKNALAAAGLPADYQTIPTLNFRNIASEELAERGLQLLDNIYERAGARAVTFLEPSEVEKFSEFRKIAINNNRIALTVNRKVMAPASAAAK